jgi:hypothetical protein
MLSERLSLCRDGWLGTPPAQSEGRLERGFCHLGGRAGLQLSSLPPWSVHDSLQLTAFEQQLRSSLPCAIAGAH